jgi:putative ABC transport system permease protein
MSLPQNFSFTHFRRSQGFIAAAILTLALAAGVNTAMFTVINALMLRPLPFPEPESLVTIYEVNRNSRQYHGGVNMRKLFADIGLVERWAQLSKSFDSIGGYRQWRLSASGPGGAERLDTVIVVADLFRVLRVKPSLGREFTKDELKGHGRVAIISYAYWARRFGSDPRALGRTIELDGYPYTIIGVMPSGYAPVLTRMPRYADIWTTAVAETIPGSFYFRGACQGIGRLKPGITMVQAQAEMDAIAAALEPENQRFRGIGVNLASAREEVADNLRPALYPLMAAVGLLLLIACANIAGLALTRQAAMQRETAVRIILGASPWRLVRDSLKESLQVSVAASILALIISHWLVRVLALMSPVHFDKIADMQIDGSVLFFVLLLSVVNTLLFGLLPAISGSRTDLNSAMKKSPSGESGRGMFTARRIIVITEIALALTLLVGASLLIKSFVLLTGVDTGFEKHHLITASLPLPETRYPTAASRQALVDALTEKLERLPGVEGVGFTNSMALAANFMFSGYFEIEGRPSTEQKPTANFVAATPDYFRAAGIPLIAGRYLTSGEALRGDAVLINQAGAKRFFAGPAQALGRHIKGDRCKSCPIVGVIGNLKNFGLKYETAPELYFGLSSLPAESLDLVVRTTSDPSPFLGAVRQEILTVAPDLAIDRINTIEDIVAGQTAQPRFNAIVIGLFAGLALLLATIGVFGVASAWVGQRTREIGVRMALGAQQRDVRNMILRQALFVGGAGAAIGTAGALFATRLLRALLFGVGPADPPTFVSAIMILLATTIMAVIPPAARAARIDPMAALRDD